MSSAAAMTFDAAGADHLDPAGLRSRGSLKWTGRPADIAAWVAESDLGTAPVVLDAVHAATARGLLGYLPPAVRQDHGVACAGWYRRRYGWSVDPAQVHPVADVLEALRVSVEHFSRPGSTIVVPTPAYMPFLTAPVAWGRAVAQVPMLTPDGTSWVLDLDAVGAALRGGGHLLLLTNPHNPTGRVHTRAELEALADVVDHHGGRVFCDEIHAPLVFDGVRHVPYASVSPAAASHTVTATSASKAWNIPGLKCAQVLLSNDADAATWAPVDRWATHGASTVGVLANTAAYDHGGPWLDGLVAYLAGNRDTLAAVLAERAPAVGHIPAQGTYLAWLDLRAALPWSTAADAPDLDHWLLERTGVSVTDGAACGTVGRGHARIALALPRPLVAEAGRRIAAALAAAT